MKQVKTFTMKPDKFDILKEVLKYYNMEHDNVLFVSTIFKFIRRCDIVYDNYDESLTIEQNIEKYLK